jgi:hypothetical protein
LAGQSILWVINQKKDYLVKLLVQETTIQIIIKLSQELELLDLEQDKGIMGMLIIHPALGNIRLLIDKKVLLIILEVGHQIVKDLMDQALEHITQVCFLSRNPLPE